MGFMDSRYAERFKQAARRSRDLDRRSIEQKLVDRLIEAQWSLIEEDQGDGQEPKTLVEFNPHQKAYWDKWCMDENCRLQTLYAPTEFDCHCDIDEAVEGFLFRARTELEIITSISDTALEVRELKNALLKQDES